MHCGYRKPGSAHFFHEPVNLDLQIECKYHLVALGAYFAAGITEDYNLGDR